MKYIAPLARAANLPSLEETAAAIGIMANAGVNGSQAGTSLKSALSRLSKPTKDMSLRLWMNLEFPSMIPTGKSSL